VARPYLDQVAAYPEVDDHCGEHDKMSCQADPSHAPSVQECRTNAGLPSSADETLMHLSLEEVEETGGELHLRLAMAFRLLGEQHADRAAPGERSPRWHVASLVAATELAASTFGAIAAGASGLESPRLDRHAATIGAVMYAAATIPSLIGLLEHDRRRLASLARTLEEHLDDSYSTPWGDSTLRAILVTVFVADPARYALLCERLAGQAEV